MNSIQDGMIAQLLLHAGMPRETETQDDLSVLLWELNQNGFRSIDITRFKGAVQNIIDCLHSLNRQLAESRQNTSAQDRMIPETLVYAMSGIMRSLLTGLVEVRRANAPREMESLLIAAAEQINFVWDQ